MQLRPLVAMLAAKNGKHHTAESAAMGRRWAPCEHA